MNHKICKKPTSNRQEETYDYLGYVTGTCTVIWCEFCNKRIGLNDCEFEVKS
jgi:hypothetical protein